jgi:ankyrin repeat protein
MNVMSPELFQAIRRHDSAQVDQLLANGADPNALSPTSPYWRPLHVAIEQLEEGGSVDVVLALLRHGADVNGWDSDADITPLLLAIFDDQQQVVEILLNAGADPNVVNGEGDSPLRTAAQKGDVFTAALLLRASAIRTVNEYGGLRGLTALGIAAKNLDIPMIRLLLEAGADRESRDEDAKLPLERLPAMSPANEAAWRAARALLLVR